MNGISKLSPVNSHFGPKSLCQHTEQALHREQPPVFTTVRITTYSQYENPQQYKEKACKEQESLETKSDYSSRACSC